LLLPALLVLAHRLDVTAAPPARADERFHAAA
jgi:hypothetical protein